MHVLQVFTVWETSLTNGGQRKFVQIASYMRHAPAGPAVCK